MIPGSAAVPWLFSAIGVEYTPTGNTGIYKPTKQDTSKNAESYHLCFIGLTNFHSLSF